MNQTRGSRPGRRLAIAAGVILLILLGTDRGGVALAERAAAETLQKSQHMPERPSVGIEGFPFLTQLASGSLDKVTVRAQEAVVGEAPRTLRLRDIDVLMRGLSVSRDLSTIRVDSGRATATVPYSELSRALGMTVRYAGEGRVTVNWATSVAGQRVTLPVTLHLGVAGGALTFLTPRVLETVGGLTTPVIEQLLALFNIVDLPLTRLPFGLHLTSLGVRENGVQFVLAGTHLSFTR